MDTRISLYKLDVFCHVVECGTVTRAAAEVGVAQPVISGHLRTLEERLGIQLFARRGRSLVLTEAGEAAYAWASDVVARTRSAASVLDGFAGVARSGVTVAACSITAGSLLPHAVLGFSRSEPDAVIQVRALTSDIALHAVADGSCDFGIVSWVDGPGPAGIVFEPLREEEIILVASPEYAGPETLCADDLGSLTYVCTPAGSMRRRSLDRQLQARGVPARRIVLELGHGDAIKSAVRSGLGVAFMARCSVDAELRSATLSEIRLNDTRLTCTITLASRTDHRWTPVQRRFVRAVRAVGASRSAQPQPA